MSVINIRIFITGDKSTFSRWEKVEFRTNMANLLNLCIFCSSDLLMPAEVGRFPDFRQINLNLSIKWGKG